MSDIQLIQFDPSTGIASLGLAQTPKLIDGITKLVQIVVLSYLRNPGQDVIDPVEGSGLRAAIGQFNFVDNDEVKILAIQRTQTVEKEVIQRQNVGVGAPTERLKALKILDIGVDSSTASAFLRVQIINEAGDTTDVIV